MGSGNPFVNDAGDNYQLKANTNAGVNLGSPYNVDPPGNARTTWTRGAFEYEGSGSTSTTSVSTTSTTSVPTTTIPTTSTSSTSVSTTSTATTTSTSTAATTSTPTTIPQTTVHYILVTLTNSRPTATPSPFQDMVSFNPSNSAYNQYEAADLGNVRFYIGTDTSANAIKSWCESGCTSGSANAVFWLRLPNGIGANSNIVVNMTFQATSVEYDGNFGGIAPQFTTPFGRYDNGKNIFTVYTNSNLFASSTPQGGWIATSNCRGISNDYCIRNSTVVSLPIVLDSYGRYVSGTGSFINFPALQNATASVFGGIGNNAGTSSIYIRDANNGAAAVIASYSVNNNTYTYTAISSSSESAQVNYGTAVTDSYSFGSANLYVGVLGLLNSASTVWFRSRAYPPSGVMPSQSFGPVLLQGSSTTTTSVPTTTSTPTTISTTTSTSTSTTSTTSVTTTILQLTTPTAPTVSASKLDIGQTVTFTTFVANGVSPYTYNFIISTTGGAIVAFGGVQSSNSFTYTVGTAGTLRANVVVKDSEAPSVTKSSAYSSTFTVASVPKANALTPDNSTIILGQGVTFNVLVSGGTGPFTLQLTASNGVAVSTLTGVAAGIRTFGTVFPQFNPSIYNVIALDTGTTNQFIFTSTSSSVTVDNAPTSTTSTSTSTTTTSTIVPQNSTTTVSSNPGGPSGNPGGPTGTGGSLKPTATLSGSCYTITNMTALKGTNVTLNGIFIGLVTNFIGPSSAGVTVNNVSYTLSQGALQTLFNQSGSSYTIELKTVTYLPIIHTIQVKVCSTSPPSTNSTSRVLIINNSGSVSTLPITSNQVTTNIGFWPGKVAVYVPNTVVTNTVYLRLNNATAATSALLAPNHYTRDFAINVSVAQNATIYLTLGYSCAINHTRVAPFLLNGAGWRMITPFTTNPSLCSVSFAVPNDPVVALMVQNQTVAQTTTISQSGSGQPKVGIGPYLIAAAVSALVIIAVLFELYRIRKGRPPGTVPQPDSASAPPEQPPTWELIPAALSDH